MSRDMNKKDNKVKDLEALSRDLLGEGIEISEEKLKDITDRFNARINDASHYGGFNPREVNVYLNPANFMRNIVYAMAFGPMDKGRLTKDRLVDYSDGSGAIFDYALRKEASGRKKSELRVKAYYPLLKLLINEEFLVRYEKIFAQNRGLQKKEKD